MALYKTITVNATTQVLIWKIEEALDSLADGIDLTEYCQKRLALLKTEDHQKQFLSIRQLLHVGGYSTKDLYYDKLGKPHLKDDKYISFSHSFHYTAIIISTQPVGIDIERQRDKILRIANKFTPLKEYRTLANDEAIIRKLTIVWGIKEAVYKALNLPGLSFLNHIYVEEFDFDHQKTTAEVHFNNITQSFVANFLEFENFACVYALSSTH